MGFFGIQGKLLLQTLVTALLSVLMVGLLLHFVMSDLHRSHAEREIEQGFTLLSNQLQESENDLRGAAAAIALNKILIASLSLIQRYEPKEDYSGLLFDAEKTKITRMLMNDLYSRQADEVLIYDANGDLTGFALRHDEQVLSGIVSYQDGQSDVRLLQGEMPAAGLLLDRLGRRIEQHRKDATGLEYHQVGSGVLQEYHQPVVRQRSKDEPVTVGTIVIVRMINESSLTRASQSSPVSFGMLSTQGEVLVALGGAGDMGQLAARHMEHEGFLELGDYMASNRSLTLWDGSHVDLIAGYPQALYFAQRQRTQTAVMVAMLFTVVLVIPISLIISRRSVLAPLQLLMSAVEAYRQAKYDHGVTVERNDELGELATAMGGMARTIREREQDLSAIIENIPMMIFVKRADDLTYVNFNTGGEKLTGLRREDLIGRSDLDFFPREQAEFFQQKDREALAAGKVVDISEEPLSTPTGIRTLHTLKVPIMNEDGSPRYLLGISEDITERKDAESRLRQWGKVFESSGEGVLISDAQCNIVAVNHAFSAITGYSEEDVLGKNPRFLKSGRHEAAFYRDMWESINHSGAWRGEIWNRRKNGDIFPMWQTISAVRDEQGSVSNYVGVFSDISSVKEAHEQLEFLAHHDPLTELPNRVLLLDRMQHAIQRAHRTDTLLAVMFIDLDRFKNINDTLGHPIGDGLLVGVSERLKVVLRETDTLARQGGDEFLLLLEDVASTQDVARFAQRLVEVFEKPFMVGGQEISITASIGISLYPEDAAEMNELVRNADAAMYKSKEHGRNQYWFYTEDITRRASERLGLEQALRRALPRAQFELYYQPQIDLESGRVTGVEALIRWHHAEHGLVAPDVFIPLAEETGLIHEIGEWVMYTACRQLALWKKSGLDIPQMAVNVSSLQVERGQLPELVQDALDASGLPSASLELELTEAVFLQDVMSSAKQLEALHELGVQLSLDDFGTGFSSLNYLKHLPFGRLKIDRSFVHDMLEDNNDLSIVRSVIALGHGLGLAVIAEGIETDDHLARLKSEGCEEGQGYLFSKPLPADECAAFVKQRNG